MTRTQSGVEHDETLTDGLRLLVLRVPRIGTLAAYVGLPRGHPLAGAAPTNTPLEVHGGVTFADEGDGVRPRGYWWLGWDYAHAGDALPFAPRLGGHVWTVAEAVAEARAAAEQIRAHA